MKVYRQDKYYKISGETLLILFDLITLVKNSRFLSENKSQNDTFCKIGYLAKCLEIEPFDEVK